MHPPWSRMALAGTVLLGLVLAYGFTLALLLHQAASLARPGDRLVVVFPPQTPVAASLEALGAAGAVFAGSFGVPWVQQAEAIDAAIGERLAGQAWVMRIPGQPTFAGCVAFVTNDRTVSRTW